MANKCFCKNICCYVAQVVSDGRVEVGCGAATFKLELQPHLVVVCHYTLTGNTSSVAPLRPGVRSFPAEYDVMEPEYVMPDYSDHDFGCPADWRP